MQTFHAKKRFWGGDLRTSINGKHDPEGNEKSPKKTACSEASRQKYYPYVYQLVIIEPAGIYYLSIIYRNSTFFLWCYL